MTQMQYEDMISKLREKFVYRVDVDPEDLSLLDQDEIGPDEGEPPDEESVIESAVIQHVESNKFAEEKAVDITNDDPDPPKEGILQGTREGDKQDFIIDKEGEQPLIIPSAIVNYYNESTMKAKQRNALADEEFGLPRLRAYPLNDRAHVKQAVRMFGHCKDPEDQKVLAKNIFKAMDKFGMEIKIGKNNALYQYAPKSMQESSEDVPGITLGGFDTPLHKRTKEDVIKEHLRMNGSFYNNVFYGPEFAKSLKSLKNFEFLDYFYPDLKRSNFSTRLKVVLGGLAGDDADVIYGAIGMRQPLCTDFSKPIGWCEQDKPQDQDLAIKVTYIAAQNWFNVDLSDDLTHIYFCLKLYSIMGEMLLDPNFDPNVNLTEMHQGILLDWGQLVQYHYDLYQEAVNGSYEQLRQVQYLYDLFWSYMDNPASEDDIAVNIVAMLHQMACVDNAVMNLSEANIPGELISKEKCTGYLIHELGVSDDLYLLPSTLQYPILNKASVRLAMDMIRRIPDEQIREYTENLNRKYKEFGCTFSISVDHPYAPYADERIIARMSHMLTENDSTVVDDDGTSTDKPDKAEQPWYKRDDYVRGIAVNILDNKELGPNEKKKQEPDYTPHDSVL